MRWWTHERMWSMWIVGGKYITCVSDQKAFEDVWLAVHQSVDDAGGPIIPNQPVVLVNAYSLGIDDWNLIVNSPEGTVTLILE